MFNDWRTRRTLQREIKDARSRFERDYNDGERNVEKLLGLQREVRFRESLFSQCESRQIIERAQQYGVEIPLNPSWWSDDSESGLTGDDVSHYLTDIGKIGVRKRIREERRSNFEWWFTKVILPSLQTLIPILSLLLAILVILKK